MKKDIFFFRKIHIYKDYNHGLVANHLWQIVINCHYLNNTTVTNPNSNWWWLTVSDKSAAVIGTIPYIQGVPKNVYTLQIIVNQVLFV